jgi:hypothetical protein
VPISVPDSCAAGDVPTLIQALSATDGWAVRCASHKLHNAEPSWTWEPWVRRCLTTRWQPLNRLCAAAVAEACAGAIQPLDADWWALTKQVRCVLDLLVAIGYAETGPKQRPGKRRCSIHLWRAIRRPDRRARDLRGLVPTKTVAGARPTA